MSIPFEVKFDDTTFSQKAYGQDMVMHCHHYMSLVTALSDQLESINAVKILRESAEDSIRTFLDAYFTQNNINSSTEKLATAKELYSVLGLGKFEVSGNDAGGEIQMKRSHVDEGWVQKFGKSSKFINHFSCGFAAAMFAAAFGKSARSYNAFETASIAMGDSEGKIVVKAN
ncbi:hypothetical protein KKF34_05690 [Myxococcota bacterium]|nr:hypothetical protein [Myxococcota bacterium]MBU1382300.1 hypothetical protein [Myxococcota bacterium]MBU1496354.1 hypothetical protein [Myxococcota bacterium]